MGDRVARDGVVAGHQRGLRLVVVVGLAEGDSPAGGVGDDAAGDGGVLGAVGQVDPGAAEMREDVTAEGDAAAAVDLDGRRYPRRGVADRVPQHTGLVVDVAAAGGLVPGG